MSIKEPAKKRVRIINTGGTIAMVHEGNDLLSPLKPGEWNQISENYPVLRQFEDYSIETSIHTFKPLLDSSNISSDNWSQMAAVINKEYKDYDGFVILHGTDTMCHTASALSFMLEHLGKPVILTGSQLPLAHPRSDALENLVTAISIAAGVDVNDGATLPLVPEVCIFFRGKLLRGNRSRKLSSSAYSGFESPNYPPLGTVGEHIMLDTRLIKEPGTEEFFANDNLITKVMMLDIFPSLDPKIIERVGTEFGVQALILKTYGAGNAPDNAKFLKAVESVVEKGILVVNVTQCPQGMVEQGLYEASAQLLDKGVISGLDMTPEAALCKLMWALGMGWEPDVTRQQMQLDLRGEQSLNIFNINYGSGHASPTEPFNGQQLIPGDLAFENLESAILQVQGAHLLGTPQSSDPKMSLRVYVNYQKTEVDPGTEGIIQYAGICAKTLDQSNPKSSVFLNITGHVKKFFNKGRPGRIGIVADNLEGVGWDKLNLALYVKV
jgi:L-asparaginase